MDESRRRFLKIGGAGLLWGFSQLCGLPTSAIASETKAEKPLDEITAAEIKKYMAMDSVDKVLADNYKDGSIKQVKYDKKAEDTNFDKLVYQKDSKDKKPVMVFFYDSIKAGKPEPSKRDAIIFKKLAQHYAGKVDFVGFDVRETKHWSDDITEKWKKITATYGIKSPPSIAMYSTFDLVNGETPDKNDGNIKQVDILKGAPNSDKYIEPQRKMCNYWINHHLLTNEMPAKIFGFENTYKIHQVK